MKNKVTRFFDIELRQQEENSNRVAGVAVVFDQETDMGWYTEKIDRHAFDETDMSDVVLNMNHDNNLLLAGTRNGSLQLQVSDSGIYQESEIINTNTGEDVMKLVRAGLLSKQSFAFVIADGGDQWTTIEGREHRTITKIEKLYDVSLVTFPAYSQTSVFARSEGEDELAKAHKAQLEKRQEQDKRMEAILNGKNLIKRNG